MNRVALRTRLRRRIQEEEADYFTDAALNTILNEALSTLQTDILVLVPDAFLSVYLANVVADQEAYAWPSGMLYEVFLEIADSSGTYTKMLRRPFSEAHETNIGNSSAYEGATEIHYAHRGRDFILSPVPTYSRTNGLRLTHVQVLTMDDDTDVPDLALPLHKVLLSKAEVLCLDEMGESSQEAEAKYQIGLVKTPNWLRKSGGDPDILTPVTPDLYTGRR